MQFIFILLITVIVAFAVMVPSPPEEPVIVGKKAKTALREKPRKIIYNHGQSVSFIAVHCMGNSGKLLELLETESPVTVDISTLDRKEFVEDHLNCLTNSERDTAIKQGRKNFNKVILEKVVTGLADRKKDDPNDPNHINP